jgi:DNA-binding CsgD family transcriptional regulator
MLGWVLRELGILAWRHDHDFEQARHHFAGGLAQFTKARFRRGCDGALLLLAAIEQELGNVEQAQLLHHDALLSMQRTYRSDHYLHLVLHGLVYLTWASGPFEHVAILLKVVDSPGLTGRAEFSEEEIHMLRACLGETLFTRVWQTSYPMTLDEAITCLVAAAAKISVKSVGHKDGLQTRTNEALTRREVEVLQLLAIGLSNREIADQLVLSVGTVKWYVSDIFSKLGVRSRTQAVAHAKELNLLA